MEWIILLLLIVFALKWLKVKFIMYVLNIKGNSFLYTILYIFGKNEIKDILKG